MNSKPIIALAILAMFIGIANDWLFWIGLSIGIPWVANNLMYKHASATARSEMLNDERIFAAFWDSGNLFMRFKDGREITADLRGQETQ